MIMGVIRRTHMCRRPRISIPLALKTEHGVAVAEIVCMDERRRRKKGSSLLVIWLCGLLLWSAWILPDGYMKVRALDGYRLSPPIGQ